MGSGKDWIPLAAFVGINAWLILSTALMAMLSRWFAQPHIARAFADTINEFWTVSSFAEEWMPFKFHPHWMTAKTKTAPCIITKAHRIFVDPDHSKFWHHLFTIRHEQHMKVCLGLLHMFRGTLQDHCQAVKFQATQVPKISAISILNLPTEGLFQTTFLGTLQNLMLSIKGTLAILPHLKLGDRFKQPSHA